VQAPNASVEATSSPEINGVDMDMDSKLIADISVAKPDAAVSLNTAPNISLDGGKAGVQMSERQLASTLPETKAETSVDATLPDISPCTGMFSKQLSASELLPSVDTKLDVHAGPRKVEGTLPSVDLTSPTLKVEAPATEVDMPSVDHAGIHAEVQPAELNTDGKFEVNAGADVGNVDLSSISAKDDIPQLNADQKIAADVDVSASAKDVKKKSKIKFPFKLSSKKDKKNVEVEVPNASVEVPSSPEVNDVDVNVDSKLSGDLSVEVDKPIASVSLAAVPSVNLDGGKAGMEMPELALTSPDTKAEASVTAVVPDIASDAQINVGDDVPSEQLSASGLLPSIDTELDVDAGAEKVEGSLPGVDMTSPTLKLEAPSAEVDMPSEFDAGIRADVQTPELDADGKLEAKAGKDVGDIELPSVSANADIPQLNADHKVAADVDLSASAKNGKKKSKIKFPFSLSSKKDKKNVEAEMPKTSIEVTSLPKVNGADMDMDSKLSGDISVSKPAAVVSVNAEPSVSLDAGKTEMQMPEVALTSPETKAETSINATLPDISPDAQINVGTDMPSEQLSVSGLLPSIDTELDVDARPGKVEGSLPGVNMTSPAPKLEAPSTEVDMPSVGNVGIHAEVQPAELDTDGKLEVNAGADVGNVDLSSVSGKADIPQLNADQKIAVDVDVSASAKDVKKKSKIKFPFKLTSKKDKKNVEVEVPNASVEMPSSPEVNDVDINVDSKLPGDLSVDKPIASVSFVAAPSVSLDGGKAGMEMPELALTSPDTKASVTAVVPDIAPDAQINVGADMLSEQPSVSGFYPSIDTKLDVDAGQEKVEGSLPGVDMTSPTLKLEAPSAEVDMPSVIDAEMNADVQLPNVDADASLDVDAGKDVGDIELPSVSANINVPPLNDDHKVAADVDLSAPAKNGKKKSKIKFPFSLSSKKDKKNVEAEVPKASIEVPGPPEINGVEIDRDSKPSGDISVSKPAAVASLDAEPRVSAESGISGMEMPEIALTSPEIKGETSANATLPDAQINVGAGMPSEQLSASGLLPSIDTELDVDAGPEKVEGSLPGVI